MDKVIPKGTETDAEFWSRVALLWGDEARMAREARMKDRWRYVDAINALIKLCADNGLKEHAIQVLRSLHDEP